MLIRKESLSKPLFGFGDQDVDTIDKGVDEVLKDAKIQTD